MATRRATAARRAGRGATAVALAVAVVLGVAACGGDPQAKVEVVKPSRDPVTHEYVIPYGTANRIAGGEKLEIVPQTLKVKVGDTIRIVNQDSFGSQVGIFHVGAGETVTMKFTTPGKLTGSCDVHPSGEFTIDVREA